MRYNHLEKQIVPFYSAPTLFSRSNEWYTPQPVAEAARRVLGAIDLDPASCEAANRIIKASKIYTIHENGLLQPWFGRVWLNPPYGGHVEDFINKLCTSDIDSALVLLRLTSLGTKYIRPLYGNLMCITDHRIHFIDALGQRINGNTGGSVLIYLGTNNRAFKREFSRYGLITRQSR